MSAVPKAVQSMAKLSANGAAAAPKSTKTMSIGAVLKQLTPEFPDVSVSKIRFLESEGLITPQRTDSGYRRFTQDDVDRLRFILTTQRDNYLPLKVIREQLEAMDSGAVTHIGASNEPVVSPDTFRAPVVVQRITEQELADAAEVTVGQVRELVRAGVLAADRSGYFIAEDAQTASLAAQLTEFGVDARHLKSLSNTAARHADLVARAVVPLAHEKGEGAVHQAQELSQQMSAVLLSLHASLLKRALRDELGR